MMQFKITTHSHGWMFAKPKLLCKSCNKQSVTLKSILILKNQASQNEIFMDHF